MLRRLWLLAAILLTASIVMASILSGGVGAQAWAATAPAPRSVELPLWGGTTATDYLAAMEQNLQYPDFNMAIDSDFTNLLAPWSDEAQQWAAMDPPDPENPPSTTAPQYTFTEDKNTVVGTSGDTVTATLTIAQSPTSGHTTNLQVVSANLIGSNAFFGQTVASVPSSCSGQVCTFTWKNPNLGAQYSGQLTMQVTVTSNDYPGNWTVYKRFYSSPTMVGKFNGLFTDSMVNGSLVIHAGVTMFATQQSACDVSGNLYAVNDSATANGTPLQHYEQTVLIDPTTTSIPFTFFGKIFTDYGDAGTFSLQDLKVQCLNIPYPAAWYMDPDAHDADIQNWAANNPSAPEASYTYFAIYKSSYTTANHPASDFSNVPYQTAQQTDAMLPDLVAQANEEAAGTSGTYTTTTLASGDTVNIDSARLIPVLIFVHGRRNPETCPQTPTSTNQIFHNEQYFYAGGSDQCDVWPYQPDPLKAETSAFKIFVQWDSWCKPFDSKSPGGNCKSNRGGDAIGGSYAVETAIRRACTNHFMCHIICHSAGCAATEDAIAHMVHKGTWNRYNVANIIEAASAAGGSEIANHGTWLPTDSTWDAHQRAAIDDSLTTSYARHHYNHDKVRVQARFIASTYEDPTLGSFFADAWWPRKPIDVTNGAVFNRGCGAYSPGPTLIKCSDNDVALHSTCAHRLPIFYQYCNTTFKGTYSEGTYSKNTFQYHGFWLDDNEFPHNNGGGTYAIGPYSQEGSNRINIYGPYPNSCGGPNGNCTFFNNYHVDHGGARNLADIEYAACHKILGLDGLANQRAWLCP